jgi:kumamolisin
MATRPRNPAIPQGYSQLKGSERRPGASARLLGPADPNEKMEATIVLRRRPDALQLPDYKHFLTGPPAGGRRMGDDEFAAKYGASQDDIDRVVKFATAQGLSIVETSAARRNVVISGTIAQFSKAFAVQLGRYEHTVKRHSYEQLRTEAYRGRDGVIHVPNDLTEIIVGVFGLDNRRVTRSAIGDPPNTTTITVPEVTGLYQFPTNSAAGQTIAIFSELGYQKSDIISYFETLPSRYPAPEIQDVTVDESNDGSEDLETTQDICIAATAAPGANIAVWFTSYTQLGWVHLLGEVAHPKPGQPTCSVLSSSFYVSNGDDPAGLANSGVTAAWVTAVDMALHDLAMQGVTVCICSGDQGSQCQAPDKVAHVTYPASDPWVLAVGGTTIGDIQGSNFEECVWNDTFDIQGLAPRGATGGGVSDFFTAASPYAADYGYQTSAGVAPASVNDGHLGRGVPDVAANASPNSGYPLNLGNAAAQGLQKPIPMSGTSASTPLWAGLIAVINAALGRDLGFVNPLIYKVAPGGFRSTFGPSGPANNSFAGTPGYPASAGWNACTGWGSPIGVNLLNLFVQNLFAQDLRFGVDVSSFGADEVHDTPTYADAFWLVLEGFTPNVLGITATNPNGTVRPSFSGPFCNLLGAANIVLAGPPVLQSPNNLFTPQRIRYPYTITFPAGIVFPTTGETSYALSASLSAPGNPAPFVAQTTFELAAGDKPNFAHANPSQNIVSG